MDDVLAKINRANKHIGDLESLWAACGKAHPNGLRVERDPQSGEVHCFVEDLTPIPVEISLIAGDAIQNLRSALDYLACGMVEKIDPTKVNTQTSFPIFKSEVDYANPKDGVTRKVPGLSLVAMQKLDMLQPYKGGHENLWILHSLNNIDKHRLLLTVGLDVDIRTLLPSEKATLSAKFVIGNPNAQFLKFEGMFMNFVQPKTFSPLKVGDKLFTLAASDADENMQLAIDVAINERDILRGVPLVLILRIISAEVSSIARDFEPFL